MADYDRSATGPLPVDAGPRRAESIFDLSPEDFRASLGEMQALGHDTDALMRQYRARNSIFAPINNAAEAQAQGLADSGRRSVLGGLLSKPEGALGMDALAGLEFEGLGGLLGAGQAVGQAFDAPAAAARGLIPQADVNMEALNTAGMAMGAGGAATAPSGALRSGLAREVGLSEAQRQARDILDMRAAGRAGEVTDDMMSRADDQYMFDNTPLPMDESSRLARADAGGFDTGTRWSHGGYGIADADRFDSNFAGDTTGNNEFGNFHFADNRDIAEDYAIQSFNRRFQDDPEGLVESGLLRNVPEFDNYDAQYAFVDDLARDNAQVMDVFAAYKNPIRENMSGERVDLGRLDEMRAAISGQGDAFDFEHMMDKPLYQFDPSDIAENKQGILDYASEYMGLEPDDMDSYDFSNAAADYLQDQGFEPDVNLPDSILVQNMVDDIGDLSNTVGNQLIMRDAANLRSRFARFDPEFSHLSNLSAANASPTAGLLAMQQEQDKPLPFMEMLRGLLR
jgi:hypothetical protein